MMIQKDFEVATHTGAIAVVALAFEDVNFSPNYEWASEIALGPVVDALQCGDIEGDLFDVEHDLVGSWVFDPCQMGA